MSCSNQRKLCSRLVLSETVTFTDNSLLINLPQANYNNNEKYCIVVAQTIPAATTITAPVAITIGTSATTYPLVNSDCTQVVACSINSRTRYSTVVKTTQTTGSFRLLGRIPCSRCIDNLASIPITTTTTGG